MVPKATIALRASQGLSLVTFDQLKSNLLLKLGCFQTPVDSDGLLDKHVILDTVQNLDDLAGLISVPMYESFDQADLFLLLKCRQEMFNLLQHVACITVEPRNLQYKHKLHNCY